MRRGWVRGLLGLLFVALIGVSLTPIGSARAAEPPECAPLPTFSAHQPYTQDAASLMAVGQTLKPGANTQVWDAAAGRPRPEFTLYEAMGMSGLTWSHSKLHQQEEFANFDPKVEYACAYLPTAMNTIANAIFDLSKLVSAGAISFRQLASNPQLVVGLLDGAVAPVNKVSTALFLGMSTVMIMLTGALIAFSGGFRGPGRQRELLQALLGVGVFMVIGTFLVIPSTHEAQRRPNYYWLTTTALDTINAANGELSSLALPRETSPWCSTTGRDGRRTFDCLVYQNTVFEPWAIGQFGTNLSTPMPYKTDQLKRFKDPANKLIPPDRQAQADMRLVQVWAQGRTATEQAYGVRPPGSPTDAANDKPDQRQGQWNIVREIMWTQYHDQFTTWSGQNSGERVALAFSSLLLSSLIGVFLIVTSGLLLLWNVVLVVLFFFLPVIALLGLFPPTQRIFRSWLQTWLKALLLSFVFSLAQTFAMLMVTAALKVPGIGSGMKSALIAIMLIALWKVVQFFRGDEVPARAASASGSGEVDIPTVNVIGRAAASGGLTAAGAAAGAGSGAAPGAPTAVPATMSMSRIPGVRRLGPLARSTAIPTHKKSDAKVAAALAEAEERHIIEHGTPMDDRARSRLRNELSRSMEEGRRRTRDLPTNPEPPTPQVQITNYNYFRGERPQAPTKPEASQDAAPQLGHRLHRAGVGSSDDRPAEVREQEAEARQMEAAFARTLPLGADARTTALSRAEHFAAQLAEAEKTFVDAQALKDTTKRQFQLVSGRHAKGQATDEELAAARRAARQASADFTIATSRFKARSNIAAAAEQAAAEYR